MYYRNEWKYLVTDADLAVLAARLKALLPMDKHQTGSAYTLSLIHISRCKKRRGENHCQKQPGGI